MDITTIKLNKSTYKKLKSLGKMGETFDDVVKKLIKHYETTKNNSG